MKRSLLIAERGTIVGTTGSRPSVRTREAMAPKNDQEKPTASSAVPSGRLNRFLQLSATAGRMAAGGVAESARRLGQKAHEGADRLPHALLTGKNASLLAARLARLRGAAMKVGQMLSLEGDSSLPPEFAKALAILRSSAHRMPRSQVEGVLRRELGSDFESKLRHFDYEAMKAASIGQVHRGQTLEGEEIVLKIQYPGIAGSIDSDVDNLRSLLSLARLLPGELNLDAFVAEVKAELHREVDYKRELEQLELYRHALGSYPGVVVPRGFAVLSTSRVLAMEYIEGQELLDWAEGAPQAERDRVARLLVDLLLHEFFVMGLMQTDPNPANYLYQASTSLLVLLDFGATREVTQDVVSLYQKGLAAIALSDEDALRQTIRELGVEVKPGSPAIELIVEICLLSSEAFEDTLFDFGASELARTLNEKGRGMARYPGHVRPPPPHFVFFQRKLMGTFLLCRNLRARVNMREALVRAGVV